jgi:effector-binding domain-containing protein
VLSEPKLIERAQQPYLGIRTSVPMTGISAFADAAFSELFAHLATAGVQQTDAPFLRYNLINMEREMEIEAGVPVPAGTAGAGRIFAGVVPAGRYAAVRHVGDYDGLMDANAALQRWAEGEGLTFAMSETDAGDLFESRLERSLVDPMSEPDSAKWETEVAYLLAD